MSDKWLNRIAFWLLCIIPLTSLVLMSKFKIVDPVFFAIGLIIYAIYYRPFVHIYRLKQLRAIEEKDAWKLFIPFYHNRFFKVLWLG